MTTTASVSYNGDGSSNLWTVPFAYLKKSHVFLTVDGVADTTFTWVTDSSIAATTTPPVGTNNVVISRTTPRSALDTVIPASGTFRGADINNQSLQALYVAEEGYDALVNILSLDTSDSKWDADSKVIKNLAAPGSDNDAARKVDVDTVAGSATAAAASAAAAASSASAAQTAETNAELAWDSFDDTYLGSKAGDPALDNDGDALAEGALYWNSTAKELRIYNGSSWSSYGAAVTTISGVPTVNTLASWVDNDTLQATTLTYDGTDLDFNGTNLIDVADVTFRTGASGGTVRTGTSAADKFVLQAYDVDGAAYQTVLQLDAGNTPVLRLDADFLEIDDDADTSKKLLFDLSGATTSTTTTFDFNQTASRTLTFPDETGTLMTHESADWVLLNTLTIGSSVADYDIDISGYTAYEELKIVVYNLTQVTDNVILRISPSYDGGSTFKQAVNENLWNFMEGDTSAGGLSGRFGGTSSGWTGGIWLQENWGNAAGEGWYGTIHLLNWTEASVNTKLFVESSAARIAGQWTYLSGVGVFYITADVEDALRFDCSSGNLDGGTFYIYGRKT